MIPPAGPMAGAAASLSQFTTGSSEWPGDRPERHFPDWRPANRQSGDWRSQQTAQMFKAGSDLSLVTFRFELSTVDF